MYIRAEEIMAPRPPLRDSEARPTLGTRHLISDTGMVNALENSVESHIGYEEASSL